MSGILATNAKGWSSAPDRKYHRAMTSRGMRIGQIVLSMAYAGLGVWSLADGDHLKGALYFAFSVAWLLIAAFRDRLEGGWKRERGRPR